MAKINILVVEDESIVSKDIQLSLKKLGYNVAGAASTGENAVEIAREKKPDLVLMDIMLKGKMNGIEAAEIIRKECKIPVVYLTAYADENTLAKAKVTEPYGYIIKPFKEIDIHTSIEMALYKHGKESEVLKERDFLYSLVEGKEQENNAVFIRSNSRLVRVETKNIYFVEALKDYVIINTDSTKYTIHSTMKDMVDKLPQNEYIRVHRSFIVRLDMIENIALPNLILKKLGKQIPIGASYKDDLFNIIKTL